MVCLTGLRLCRVLVTYPDCSWLLFGLLDGLDFLADLDGSADNFVANADWQRAVTPPTVDGVEVRGADTAALNGNVNVTVLEGLELELWYGQ